MHLLIDRCLELRRLIDDLEPVLIDRSSALLFIRLFIDRNLLAA
ncbi:hypothetical protein [Natronococcus jeotgali]|nr:hypothetical protein [Natronococcus jeotgali]